jgi:hypothetical protein
MSFFPYYSQDYHSRICPGTPYTSKFIHPGVIQIPMTEPTLRDPGVKQMMLSRLPIGRLGEPERQQKVLFHSV